MRGIFPKLPSVVTKTATVECSETTLCVPISAASSKGIGVLDQGVFTIRGFPSILSPCAPSTKYPTQSISLTFALILSSKLTRTDFAGTNLG